MKLEPATITQQPTSSIAAVTREVPRRGSEALMDVLARLIGGPNPLHV